MSKKTALLLISLIVILSQGKYHIPEPKKMVSPITEGIGSREIRKGLVIDYEKEYIGKRKISWYGRESCTNPNCNMANGHRFNPGLLTTACWNDYSFNTEFLISFQESSVRVSCTDRGGFRELGRFLDLSAGAFNRLAPLSKGILEADIWIIR